MEWFASAEELLSQRRPERPVLCVRPHAAARAAHWFLTSFPGTVIYALKANDAPEIVAALRGAGIRHFDVSSLREMEWLSTVQDAKLHMMHPVKSRGVIRAAYDRFGVRTFAFDSEAELEKIKDETKGGGDLRLMLRLDCSGEGSLIPLPGKFGVDNSAAPKLLVAAASVVRQLGVTFHVGSQAMEPERFRDMLAIIGRIAALAGVKIDHIDVGGGFPSRYPGIEPPPLAAYISEIEVGVAALGPSAEIDLSCEPGRALVAEAESVLVRVEARRGTKLHINDGAFGTLYDAAHSGFRYPARLIGPEAAQSEPDKAFTLYGPSCDSADMIPGPTWLPDAVKEGDYIEIGQIGAYGRVLATRFNGFGDYEEVALSDAPMMTMYRERAAHSPQADADAMAVQPS